MNTYISYWEKIPKSIKDIEIDLSIYNKSDGKPKRSLWGSPVDAELGWKDFGLLNGIDMYKPFEDECSFKWTLADNARILHIHNLTDIRIYNKCDFFISPNGKFRSLDFEYLFKLGYDAVELHNPFIGKNQDATKEELAFFYWDCESIVLLKTDNLILL
jgi:hypothetical protein